MTTPQEWRAFHSSRSLQKLPAHLIAPRPPSEAHGPAAPATEGAPMNRAARRAAARKKDHK